METTTDTTTVEAVIPFMGFYESMHSEAVEDCLSVGENDFYESGKDGNPTKEEIEKRLDTIDWSLAHKEYATALIAHVSELLGFPLEFVEVNSPREYNFTTDRLFVKAPLSALISLFGKTDYEALTKRVEEKFTSRDGFMSFYSNDLVAWEGQGLTEWDHNQWETVIETYLEQEYGEDWELNVMDDVRGNGGGQSQ